MSKEEVKSVLNSLLLALQLCLGLWQILKLTPVGAMVKGVMGWLLLPFGISPTYAKLKHLQGRVLKEVNCVGLTTAAFQPIASRGKSDEMSDTDIIESSYLGVDFKLQRRGPQRNMLFLGGKMCYYITDKIWVSLVAMAHISPTRAFVKGYKKIWLGVVAGGVMSLSEVMDNLILDNQVMVYLNQSGLPERLLPVDLSVSEEKLLKVLNLVGLFLQTKKVYWVIPMLFSLTAVLLEFLTAFRLRLYGRLNLLFCYIMHLICDGLPRSIRKELYYSLGYWVENLKPSNDIQLRRVRGNINAIIAGGAKAHIEGAMLVPMFEDGSPEPTGKYWKIQSSAISIYCEFDEDRSKCRMYTTVGVFEVDCVWDEFINLRRFLSGVAKTGSGSLKSYDLYHRVSVREFWGSLICYIKSGYPPVYGLELNNAIVF